MIKILLQVQMKQILWIGQLSWSDLKILFGKKEPLNSHSNSLINIQISLHKSTLQAKCSIQISTTMDPFALIFWRTNGAPFMMYGQFWLQLDHYFLIQTLILLLTMKQLNCLPKIEYNIIEEFNNASNNLGMIEIIII